MRAPQPLRVCRPCVPSARRRFRQKRHALLKTIPDAVLGCLLVFSGIELTQSSTPQGYRDADLFLVLLMAAIGVALDPVAAFAVGLPIAYGL
jgi:MFS superfamily sulfate permease-like transporter